MPLSPQALPLLHIDDNPNDRLLVREAIVLTDTPFALFEADTVESATLYFQTAAEKEALLQYPAPALVLLDYDLGGQTGADFLYWLRVLRGVKSLPVAMFSGSPGAGHVAECYRAGATFFLNKPSDLTRLRTIIKTLYSSLCCGRPDPVFLLDEYQPDPSSTRTSHHAHRASAQ